MNIDQNKATNKNAPYFQVVTEALVKWNELSQEAAEDIVQKESMEKLNEMTGGSLNSVMDAINSLSTSMELSEIEREEFTKEILGQTDSTEISDRLKKDMKIIRAIAGERELDVDSDIAIEALRAVHDGWVERNTDQFFTKKQDREQQYQYLPLELIGWNEAKSDLLFVAPILKSMGVEVSEIELKMEYNNKVSEYLDWLQNEEIITLEEAIREGCFGYDEHWTPEMKAAFENEHFVGDVIMEQLENKGFGADKQLLADLQSDGIFEFEEHDFYYWQQKSATPGLSEKFMREHQDDLHWNVISKCQYVSETFMREFSKALDFNDIAKRQQISEEFINEFKQKFDMTTIFKHQNLSEDFIEQHKDEVNWDALSSYTGLNESMIEKCQQYVNWDNIAKNARLSEGFIEKHQNDMDWTLISKHQKLSEEFIEKFADRVDWKMISLEQELSEEFIEKHVEEIDWSELYSHQNLSREFVEKHIDKFDYHDLYNNDYYDYEYEDDYEYDYGEDEHDELDDEEYDGREDEEYDIDR